MHSKRTRDLQQVADLRLFPVLDPLDCAAVYAGRFGETFLGHVEVYAPHANLIADRSSGIEDPLVICGGHGSHAPPKIILCPQQFCGII
ncbi:hypothetical protein J2S51_005963 [Streptomyces sp. DSM 41269]|nr:hypothetical protein [Streptomyces sp. DSM 41269]